MSRLVHAFEDGRANPWPYELPAAYVEKLFKAIVFFELPITRLEGKYKVSQNRSALEQQRVADRLSTSASLEDVAMGLEMKRLQGRG
jgi:transcriptional regulator